eukprot:COSAG05_NODE_6508_length_945_cov_41.241135_1_plen_66_part_01
MALIFCYLGYFHLVLQRGVPGAAECGPRDAERGGAGAVGLARRRLAGDGPHGPLEPYVGAAAATDH